MCKVFVNFKNTLLYQRLKEIFMSKTTITDIAKEAKVSLGTVSNVLNHRGNVKADTIRKVEKAAIKLNYVRDISALSIRQKKSTQIALMIPQLNEFTNDLYTNLYHELKTVGLTIKIFETNNNLELEKNCLTQIKQDNFCGIFIINHLEPATEICEFFDNPKNLIFIGNYDNKDIRQVSINLKSLKSRFGESTFFIKDEFGIGFYKQFDNDHIINDNMTDIYQKIREHPQSNFVTFNSKLASRLQTISKTLDSKIKITLISSKNIVTFEPDSQRNVFHYSANKIALSLIKMLKSQEMNSKINIYNTDYQLFTYTKEKTSLNLLLLETPFSQIIKFLLPDLREKYNITINLTTKNFSQMQMILNSNEWQKYDLIRLDISDFNWFGNKIFRPLNQLSELKNELSRLSNWNQYIYQDKTPYALPLDPSVQIMLYKNKIFNNEIIKKRYSDKYNQNLIPPVDYQSLVNLAKFFNASNEPEINGIKPLSLMGTADILIASEFLPYYYSLKGKINQTENGLQFDTDIFIETYNLYKELRKTSNIESKNWWDSEVNDFNDDKTAILIGFSNHLNNLNPTEYSIAPIPGNKPALGGGLIGINKYSNKNEASVVFLKWLFQYQIQHEIALMGGDIPATELFFEREIYEKFPFLSYSTGFYHNGIRKTRLSKDTNLYTLLFEKIIGKEIKTGIDENLDAASVLVNINTTLLLNRDKLISKNNY